MSRRFIDTKNTAASPSSPTQCAAAMPSACASDLPGGQDAFGAPLRTLREGPQCTDLLGGRADDHSEIYTAR